MRRAGTGGGRARGEGARRREDEEADSGDEHGDAGHDRRDRELCSNESEHLPQEPALHAPVALGHRVAIREVVRFLVKADVLGGPGLRGGVAGDRAWGGEGAECLA